MVCRPVVYTRTPHALLTPKLGDKIRPVLYSTKWAVCQARPAVYPFSVKGVARQISRIHTKHDVLGYLKDQRVREIKRSIHQGFEIDSAVGVEAHDG